MDITFQLVIAGICARLNHNLYHISNPILIDSYEGKSKSYIKLPRVTATCKICQAQFSIIITNHKYNTYIRIAQIETFYVYEFFIDNNQQIKEYIESDKFKFSSCDECLIKNIIE